MPRRRRRWARCAPLCACCVTRRRRAAARSTRSSPLRPYSATPQVYICSRSAADVEAAVAELRAAGHAARGSAADVSQRAGCEALVAAVSDAFGGRLDILSE